jgi:hypothetical protein
VADAIAKNTMVVRSALLTQAHREEGICALIWGGDEEGRYWVQETDGGWKSRRPDHRSGGECAQVIGARLSAVHRSPEPNDGSPQAQIKLSFCLSDPRSLLRRGRNAVPHPAEETLCASCGNPIAPGKAYACSTVGGPWHRLCIPPGYLPRFDLEPPLEQQIARDRVPHLRVVK